MSRPLPISNVPLNRLHKYRTAGWWCRPMERSTPIAILLSRSRLGTDCQQFTHIVTSSRRVGSCRTASTM